MKRVVVTGMSVVTALGDDWPAFKENLLEIQQKRLQGRATIPAAEVDKRYGIEP